MAERQRVSRSVERTREFRDQVLKIFADWQTLEKSQTVAGGWGWKIALVDVWDELVKEGGEDDGLAPFFL